MNILIGYGNSLGRDFVQNHLAAGDPSVRITTVGTVRECIKIVRDNLYITMVGLDLEMSDMEGVASLDAVKKNLLQPLPIALIGPPATRRVIRDMLVARAAGYLTYTMSPAATLSALKLIASGEAFVPAKTVAEEETMAGASHLTGRQHDVLVGLLSGDSNKEIARVLDFSEVTIKHHLKSLRSKLNAKNRTHAVCRAIELGIS